MKKFNEFINEKQNLEDNETYSLMSSKQKKNLERILIMVDGFVDNMTQRKSGIFEIDIQTNQGIFMFSPKDLIELSKLVIDVTFDSIEYGDFNVMTVQIK